MRYLIFTACLFFQFICCTGLIAQKKCGKLVHDKSYQHSISISEYHQYQLKLDKDEIALLRIVDADIRVLLTMVSPDGIIIEEVSTAETADFLLVKAPVKGKYEFYIQFIDDDDDKGKYTLKPHFISNQKDKLAQITTILQLMEKPGRAGIAVAIVENGDLIYEHYNGFANVENKVLNNKETVFELASVSKQFTGMAIAKLAEQNKLSIEDDIRKYFPELPIYKTPIKIKHLLNHTSGLISSDDPLGLAGFENNPVSLEHVLNFHQNTPDQYFEPGTEFEYSNDGYTLLGELVHRITKQSFNDWSQLNMFDALGMDLTVIRDSPETIIPNRATSYVAYTNEQQFRRLSFDFYAPGGCGVRSNVADLVKWIDFLNKGYHSEEKLFQRINQVENFPDGAVMEYAYGSFITDFRGLKRFSHLGLSAGFRTAVARFPEQNLGFIVLGNDGEWLNYYLSRKIYELYLSNLVEPKTTKFEGIEIDLTNNELADKKKVMPTQVDLSDYEGSYFSQQINATYTFQVMRDSLFALSSAYPPISILSVTNDTLVADEGFMETIVFKRDFNQEVSECKIYNEVDDYGISFTKIPTSKKWKKASHWKSPKFKKAIKDSLNKIEASKVLPGFVVSVFDESEIFMQEGFGYANVENKKSYNPETVQLIASISKSITAVAIMKAMEMGYFKLDDLINDHLPYKIINPNFPDEGITIRHLLTHSSSLDDPDNYDHGYVFQTPLDAKNWPSTHHKYFPYLNNNEQMSLSDFVTAITSPKGKWYNQTEMFTKEKPGTNFEYSNLGFALLGQILEITTKEQFKVFTQKHILDPLEMKSSTWELEKVDAKHHSTYYLENYNPCPNYVINSIPDGGLYTNVIDLTKFLQEAMKGYAGHGTILTQSSYTEMFKSQSNLFEIDGGLGWDLSFACCIGHAGNDYGTSTFMFFEPNTGIGRIIFSNVSMEIEEIQNAMYGMMELLFQEE